ncbi:helix-turn-helix domain-containing protein [Micromonospora sp. NPDC048894]
MTCPGQRDRAELPIGRQVARWRVRRRMTQQVFADRLGKSKSWVDKVERGVRALDRYSVIQEIAEVLHLDPAILLGPRQPSPSSAIGLDGIDAVRAALARYHRPRPRAVPGDQVERHLAHAWLTYQHAHYAQLLRSLPALLDAVHGALALLVPAYRITASVLVKLGEADLAWLAADRAVNAAEADPTRSGSATIAVAQALRALGRDRLALTACVAAADTTTDDAVRGMLLVQAGLAAAGSGDRRNAEDLLEHAADLADHRLADDDPQHACFGPTAVLLAFSLAASTLGDPEESIHLHERAIRRADWPQLPAEHRAAHLIDAARAYLQAGNLAAAGYTLLDADITAPAEVRYRPYARTVIAEIARSGPAAAGVTRLAAIVGLTR